MVRHFCIHFLYTFSAASLVAPRWRLYMETFAPSCVDVLSVSAFDMNDAHCFFLSVSFLLLCVCVHVCTRRLLSCINQPPCAKSVSSRCASPHKWRDGATAKLQRLGPVWWRRNIEEAPPQVASQAWSCNTGERGSPCFWASPFQSHASSFGWIRWKILA